MEEVLSLARARAGSRLWQNIRQLQPPPLPLSQFCRKVVCEGGAGDDSEEEGGGGGGGEGGGRGGGGLTSPHGRAGGCLSCETTDQSITRVQPDR